MVNYYYLRFWQEKWTIQAGLLISLLVFLTDLYLLEKVIILAGPQKGRIELICSKPGGYL